jgi:hypothetical protein
MYELPIRGVVEERRRQLGWSTQAETAASAPQLRWCTHAVIQPSRALA